MQKDPENNKSNYVDSTDSCCSIDSSDMTSKAGNHVGNDNDGSHCKSIGPEAIRARVYDGCLADRSAADVLF